MASAVALLTAAVEAAADDGADVARSSGGMLLAQVAREVYEAGTGYRITVGSVLAGQARLLLLDGGAVDGEDPYLPGWAHTTAGQLVAAGCAHHRTRVRHLLNTTLGPSANLVGGAGMLMQLSRMTVCLRADLDVRYPGEPYTAELRRWGMEIAKDAAGSPST